MWTVDGGQQIDYGCTSEDYAAYRPGPPASFYERLEAFGIGGPKQRVLDLGTGTGVIARALARGGSLVSAVDVSEAQIFEARRLAINEGLSIDFRVGSAEEPPFREKEFDAAIGNQCFLYFNQQRTLESLRRLLVPGGQLVISHFRRLAGRNAIVDLSEALIKSFNPKWEGAGFTGEVEARLEWVPLPEDIAIEGFFWYDVDVFFTRETWRGRIRSSRGVGASLPEQEVGALDAKLEELLKSIAPERFPVKHRIDARFLRFLC